jgi:hypothetical protein
MAFHHTTPQKTRPNDAKLRELILLISEWCQPDEKFGAVKLNKLLFHADFSAFLTYSEPITGQEYFKLPNGPAPRRLVAITEAMIKKGEFAWQEVTYYGYPQKKPVALRAADTSKFSGPEVALIRQTVEKFWKMNATEISDQSHVFLGWKAVHLKETIPYNTALVSRRTPTDHEKKRGFKASGARRKASECCPLKSGPSSTMSALNTNWPTSTITPKGPMSSLTAR